jgi:addiction module RelE/StbE family toxin
MVTWTPRARADLKAIHDHIAKDSPATAKTIARELACKPDILLRFPLIGHKVPEVNDDNLRELSLHSWRIIYHLRQDGIHIITLVHKRQQSPSDSLAPRQTQLDSSGM